MGQYEAVVCIVVIDGKPHVLAMHFDTKLILLDVNERKPVAWGGRSKTDANLINKILDSLGLSDEYKAKFTRAEASKVMGTVSLHNNAGIMQNGPMRDGEIKMPASFLRFIAAPYEIISTVATG